MREGEPLLLLHSSNFSERYQSNILDFLCYPAGHVVTLRYQAVHVHPEVRAMVPRDSARKIEAFKEPKRALAVYAETHDDVFWFFPVRYMEILRLHREGTVYYVDARLGRYYRYQPSGAHEHGDFKPSKASKGPLPLRSGFAWDLSGERKVDSQVPAGADGRKGYFLFRTSDPTGEAVLGQAPDEREAWERVVDVISSTKSMRRCLFFLVQLREVRRRRLLGVIPLFGFERCALDPRDHGLTTRYYARAAGRLELTVLSYRSERAERGVLPRVLSLELGAEAFGTASHKEVRILNRYNEERIEIPTRRVLEATAGSVRVALRELNEKAPDAQGEFATAPDQLASRRTGRDPLATESELVEKAPSSSEVGVSVSRTEPILAPEPFLLVYVRPPAWALAVILCGAVVAALLLTLGPDSILPLGRFVERHISATFGLWMQGHPGPASGLSKAVGSVVTLITGYLGLRKLPVGK